MLSALPDPRRVGTGLLQPPGGDDSVQQLLASVSADDARFRSTERILTAAYCGTCNRPVMRKFDIEGLELVIHPWEHHSPIPIAHPVGEICTEKKYE